MVLFVEVGLDLTGKSSKEEENSEAGTACGGWCPPGLEEGGSTLWRIYWFITYLFRLPMFLTIPDCRKKRWRKFYLPAFFSCLVWIGGLSYLVVWMITVIGRGSFPPRIVILKWVRSKIRPFTRLSISSHLLIKSAPVPHAQITASPILFAFPCHMYIVKAFCVRQLPL